MIKELLYSLSLTLSFGVSSLSGIYPEGVGSIEKPSSLLTKQEVSSDVDYYIKSTTNSPFYYGDDSKDEWVTTVFCLRLVDLGFTWKVSNPSSGCYLRFYSTGTYSSLAGSGYLVSIQDLVWGDTSSSATYTLSDGKELHTFSYVSSSYAFSVEFRGVNVPMPSFDSTAVSNSRLYPRVAPSTMRGVRYVNYFYPYFAFNSNAGDKFYPIYFYTAGVLYKGFQYTNHSLYMVPYETGGSLKVVDSVSSSVEGGGYFFKPLTPSLTSYDSSYLLSYVNYGTLSKDNYSLFFSMASDMDVTGGWYIRSKQVAPTNSVFNINPWGVLYRYNMTDTTSYTYWGIDFSSNGYNFDTIKVNTTYDSSKGYYSNYSISFGLSGNFTQIASFTNAVLTSTSLSYDSVEVVDGYSNIVVNGSSTFSFVDFYFFFSPSNVDFEWKSYYSSSTSTSVFTLLGNAFSSVGSVFGLELLPGLSIGLLVFIPLVVAIILAVVGLFKR